MLAPRFGRLPARRGHDKNRGADPGDRRPGRGLGDLREEPPASAGGLRYELRVSRLAHGGRVWVAVETTVGYLIDIDIILLLVPPLAVNGRASFRHPRTRKVSGSVVSAASVYWVLADAEQRGYI